MELPGKAMIVAHGKYGHELYESATGLLCQRIAEGIYYENENDGDPRHQWLTRALAIERAAQSAPDPDLPMIAAAVERTALAFLEERQDFEYEGFEVKYPIRRDATAAF
jgi:hypothetical protein